MINLSSSDFFALGTVSFLVVGFTTPFMRKIALHFNVIDKPVETHKTHTSAVPYLGGIAIILGVVLVTYLSSFFSEFTSETFFLSSTILAPAVIMGLVGLVDDIRKLSPWPRFITQNFFGLAISIFLVSTDTLGSPFGNTLLDILLSSIWIVGITNAVNFFDNIDGGATGTIAITSSFLFYLSWQGQQILIAAMSIVLAGATIGFLAWNKPPARIYMGDAGALFLGVMIASLTIRFDPNPINKYSSFAIPCLLLAVPILDTSVAVISRLQRGISPFQGGKDHLSHRLMEVKFTKKQAILILWLLSLFFSLIAVAISYSSYRIEGIFAIFALFAWACLLVFFLRLKPLNQ